MLCIPSSTTCTLDWHSSHFVYAAQLVNDCSILVHCYWYRVGGGFETFLREPTELGASEDRVPLTRQFLEPPQLTAHPRCLFVSTCRKTMRWLTHREELIQAGVRKKSHRPRHCCRKQTHGKWKQLEGERHIDNVVLRPKDTTSGLWRRHRGYLPAVNILYTFFEITVVESKSHHQCLNVKHNHTVYCIRRGQNTAFQAISCLWLVALSCVCCRQLWFVPKKSRLETHKAE